MGDMCGEEGGVAVGRRREKVQLASKKSLVASETWGRPIGSRRFGARTLGGDAPWNVEHLVYRLTKSQYNCCIHVCVRTRRNDDIGDRTTMNTITQLYNEHPKTILFASAAALRLLLTVAFPALPDLLTLRAEISTPVNGFKRRM